MDFLPENLCYKRFYLKLRSLILNWDFRFKQSLSQRLERKDKRRKGGQEGGRKEVKNVTLRWWKKSLELEIIQHGF